MAAEERIIEYTTERAHVRVHIPILTEEEYNRRRAAVERELVRYYKECIKQGLDWDEISKPKNKEKKQ